MENNQPNASADEPGSVVVPFISSAGEDENDFVVEEQGDPFALGNVAPFQVSGALPMVDAGSTTAFAAPPPLPLPARRPRRTRSLSLLMALAAGAGVLLLLALALIAFAAPTAPQTTRTTHPSASATGIVPPTRKPTQSPNPTPTSWVPQRLPNGWTAAGLTTADAVFALRTALTFTDREMGLDYRNVGTRATHAGTMTAALFLLTPAGQARFQHNDVRAITNTLFDQVEQDQLVQAAVTRTPALVQFQVVGQQQCAWVTVSFVLWQTRLNPKTHQRTEGLDMDPATQRPRLHQMAVLVLRVPYAVQGNTPAMGGSGWLVSTYALDSGLPALLQPA